jgi:DNA-binding transcriptional ArsR family regulator
MPRDRRQLVVDVDTAAALRAQVGPIGWLVLEAIAGHAPPGRGVVEVKCSSRSLAGIVGVSKDSVARAIRSLTDAGIVERVDHREERSGRFTSTTYLVDLGAAGIAVVTVSQGTVPAPVVTDLPLTDPRSPGDQLSLLT